MRLLNRKSKRQQLLETLNASLDVASARKPGLRGGINPGLPSAIRSALPGLGSRNTLRAGLPHGRVPVKAGLIAGGLAGLTAGSAGISSLRRRNEGGGTIREDHAHSGPLTNREYVPQRKPGRWMARSGEEQRGDTVQVDHTPAPPSASLESEHRFELPRVHEVRPEVHPASRLPPAELEPASSSVGSGNIQQPSSTAGCSPYS